jgi:KDO2-lipid IV(A) lauroyltransferase
VRRLLLQLGAALGVLAYLLGIRRSVALDNLARAFPDRSDADRRRLARAAFAQLGRSLAEIAVGTPAVRFDGWDVYQRARAEGRGVVVAIAHYGNFELLARAAGARGESVTLIGRRLRGPFNRWLVEGRGIRTLPDRGAGAAAVAALRRGEVLAIAIDQNMRPSRGVFVEFFGAQASTTPAAAVYALRAGAPLIAAFPVRQPDGSHLVSIRGPFATDARAHAAVLDLTQQLTRAVEQAVREHPDHWFWVHRRWKTQPGEVSLPLRRGV